MEEMDSNPQFRANEAAALRLRFRCLKAASRRALRGCVRI